MLDWSLFTLQVWYWNHLLSILHFCAEALNPCKPRFIPFTCLLHACIMLLNVLQLSNCTKIHWTQISGLWLKIVKPIFMIFSILCMHFIYSTSQFIQIWLLIHVHISSGYNFMLITTSESSFIVLESLSKLVIKTGNFYEFYSSKMSNFESL